MSVHSTGSLAGTSQVPTACAFGPGGGGGGCCGCGGGVSETDFDLLL